ncbi:MAG: hypothetical protein MOGMAGMI_01804 [Candidatus Omnitrophica bacterium]|nr:hypothetical protein [Candidatus Omnitrophota bacterium]
MDKKIEPKLKYAYQCTACTETAIETSNKMLGVQVECKNCKRVIELQKEDNYKTL